MSLVRTTGDMAYVACPNDKGRLNVSCLLDKGHKVTLLFRSLSTLFNQNLIFVSCHYDKRHPKVSLVVRTSDTELSPTFYHSTEIKLKP